MFDDPQKELKRLEEELLKNEMNDDDFEQFYRGIFEEFGPGEEQEVPAERAAAPRKTGTYADAPRAVAPKKKKGVRGLVITIILECAGIAAIVLWWLLRIL